MKQYEHTLLIIFLKCSTYDWYVYNASHVWGIEPDRSLKLQYFVLIGSQALGYIHQIDLLTWPETESLGLSQFCKPVTVHKTMNPRGSSSVLLSYGFRNSCPTVFWIDVTRQLQHPKVENAFSAVSTILFFYNTASQKAPLNCPMSAGHNSSFSFHHFKI